jgi:hypothetical protein
MKFKFFTAVISIHFFIAAFGQQTNTLEVYDFNEKSVETFMETELKTEPSVISSQVFDTNMTHIQFKLPSCPYTIENANKNIENDQFELVICGAFTGFPEEDQKKSEAFRKKYNISFCYVGCIRFYDPAGEDIDGFNKIMKNHLKSKYGSKCLAEYEAIFK